MREGTPTTGSIAARAAGPAPVAPSYALRPATRADADFACEVKLRGLQPHVEALTSTWDEGRQRASFHEGFDPERTEIVLFEGAEVGILRVEARDQELYLAEIYLTAATRNRGLGSAIVRDLIRAAHATGRPLRLQLLRTNPVRRLYERLGFRTVAETGTHYRMECPCPAEAS